MYLRNQEPFLSVKQAPLLLKLQWLHGLMQAYLQ